MKTHEKIRVSTFLAATTAMVLSFQNCGRQGPNSTTSSNSGGGVSVEQPLQDPVEKKILSDVLASYQACDAVSDPVQKSDCRAQALQSAVSVSAKANEAINPIDFVCYVFGPLCKTVDKADPTVGILGVQNCRAQAVQEGSSFEGLNQMMASDPAGYVNLINNKCLYDQHRCVIAYRCVPRALVNLPDNNPTSSN